MVHKGHVVLIYKNLGMFKALCSSEWSHKNEKSWAIQAATSSAFHPCDIEIKALRYASVCTTPFISS